MTSLFELATRQREILTQLKFLSYKLEIFILINFQRNNIDMKKKKTIYGKREKDLPEVIEWCYFI